MALYHKFFGDYEAQQPDDYHGEYDDEAYGSLYIPHIEEQHASLAEVKRVFLEKKIGDVTSVTFTALVAPSTYKGKNKKKAYSAIVYLKWRATKAANAVRQALGPSNKNNTLIKLDAKQYWVVHFNTAMFSEALYEERYYVADMEDTAMDAVFRILEDTEEDLNMYDLEDTAMLTMRILEDTEDDLNMYALEDTALLTMRILEDTEEDLVMYALEDTAMNAAFWVLHTF